MRVIPSRADGEGPHRRYKVTQVITATFGPNDFVDREA
jgi:hypothetical protein